MFWLIFGTNGQNQNVGLVQYLAIYPDFYGLNLSYILLLLFQRLLYKKQEIVKKNLKLTDYFTFYKLDNKSTPFQYEKKSANLKICLIFIVNKVLEYSNIGVYFSNKKGLFVFKFTHAFRRKNAYHTSQAFTKYYYYIGCYLTLKSLCRLILSVSSSFFSL